MNRSQNADITRVMILGATGVFGGRLAEILAQDARFELILTGRNETRAARIAENLEGPARLLTAAFDLAAIRDALKKYAPHIVIHCAGPFQGQDYSVAQAAIAAGVNYADLSDGRVFSQDFAGLDASAKAAGVFALTACSTTSALTIAAALRLAKDFASVESISVGVTPGNRAPRGPAVVRAILSYVGEPIPVWRNGVLDQTVGWGTLSHISLPGLGARWFSPCDAPDLPAMRMVFPSARNIDFSAGLELPVLHLPLWLLAQLRRRRLIPNLTPMSGLFHRIATWFEPFGSDQGGMFVEIDGREENGERLRKRWSLWAGAGHGPYIPAMAAAALAKKWASGEDIKTGARMTAGDIAPDDFEREFAQFNISTKVEIGDDADDVSKTVWRQV